MENIFVSKLSTNQLEVKYILESGDAMTTGEICSSLGYTEKTDKKRISGTIAQLRKKNLIAGDDNLPVQWLWVGDSTEIEDLLPVELPTRESVPILWVDTLNRLEVFLAPDIAAVLEDIREHLQNSI